jgi:hypothetical protein
MSTWEKKQKTEEMNNGRVILKIDIAVNYLSLTTEPQPCQDS